MKELVNIQQELRAPKDLHNSFGGYSYRSAESILEAVKPLLKKYNATLTLSDQAMLVGTWNYIEATATLTVYKDKEDKVYIARAYARESEVKKGMDTAQITGAASSYARKYALNGLFAIDDTKDPDSDEHQKQSTKTESKSTKKSVNNDGFNL